VEIDPRHLHRKARLKKQRQDTGGPQRGTDRRQPASVTNANAASGCGPLAGNSCGSGAPLPAPVTDTFICGDPPKANAPPLHSADTVPSGLLQGTVTNGSRKHSKASAKRVDLTSLRLDTFPQACKRHDMDLLVRCGYCGTKAMTRGTIGRFQQSRE